MISSEKANVVTKKITTPKDEPKLKLRRVLRRPFGAFSVFSLLRVKTLRAIITLSSFSRQFQSCRDSLFSNVPNDKGKSCL